VAEVDKLLLDAVDDQIKMKNEVAN